MKTKIFSLISLLAFAGVAQASAQANDTTVHKSVNVTREFQPVIMDVGKIITSPKVLEPDVVRGVPSYSNIASPLGMDFNVHLLKPTELLHTPPAARKAYARVGFGYPINTLADVMYPIINNANNRLDADVHHIGAFGDKFHSKTNGAIRFNHLFDKIDLYANLRGQHDFYNYYSRSYAGETPVILSDFASKYGSLTYQSLKNELVTINRISSFPADNIILRLNAEAGLRSLPQSEGKLNFDAGLSYNMTNIRSVDVTENRMRLKAIFEVPFNANKLGMDIDINNFQYKVNKNTFFDFDKAYSIIKINPYVNLKGSNWKARLGAKAGLSLGHGLFFTPSPDVSAEWNAIHDYLAIYGGATGDLEINSLDKTFSENRYFSPNDRLEDTYTPLNAYIGLKLSPVHNLIFDLYAQYKVVHNQYFFVNRQYIAASALPTDTEGLNMTFFSDNRFNAIYSEANRSSLGLRTSWSYKNILDLYAKAAYHHWEVRTEYQAWHLPKWDTDFGATMKIGSNISLNAQFIFQDGRYARLVNPQGFKMQAITDLNLGASYSYRDWVSFFVKANNIFNKKYSLYNGYEVQGVNAMVGAAFSF